jgi:hypothetical protein
MICLSLVTGVTFASVVGSELRDSWVFNHMTSSQHLWEANKSTPDLGDVEIALRHISAIPKNAHESASAQVLKTTLKQKLSEMKAEEANRATAKADKDQQAKAAADARSIAVTQFALDLKNLGYDLSVKVNHDVPNEIVLTSSEFGDTDHRVRFLAFMRSRNNPEELVCLSGFTTIRLRTSAIPFVGFDDSYSLNCFN